MGTPFELNLNTLDIDQFLYQKISKKLDYWSNMKLALAGRVVICNQMLLSRLWFFFTVWGGGPIRFWGKLGAPFGIIFGQVNSN